MKPFTETDFQQAADAAVAVLSHGEYEYALDYLNHTGKPISTSEIASGLGDAMSDWCMDHGFESDAWMFDYSLDDVVLKGNRYIEQ